jgi:hypothetical protein
MVNTAKSLSVDNVEENRVAELSITKDELAQIKPTFVATGSNKSVTESVIRHIGNQTRNSIQLMSVVLNSEENIRPNLIPAESVAIIDTIVQQNNDVHIAKLAESDLDSSIMMSKNVDSVCPKFPDVKLQPSKNISEKNVSNGSVTGVQQIQRKGKKVLQYKSLVLFKVSFGRRRRSYRRLL